MIDKKQVDKINRLAELLHELKSEEFEKKYKMSHELARRVFLQELEELESTLEKMKGESDL